MNDYLISDKSTEMISERFVNICSVVRKSNQNVCKSNVFFLNSFEEKQPHHIVFEDQFQENRLDELRLFYLRVSVAFFLSLFERFQHIPRLAE